MNRVRDSFAPDFLLISSGFDVLAGDPLGGQLLEPEDLHHFTVELRRWAEEAFDGRMVVLLEGGYVPERVGEGVVAVLRGLAGLEAEVGTGTGAATEIEPGKRESSRGDDRDAGRAR